MLLDQLLMLHYVELQVTHGELAGEADLRDLRGGRSGKQGRDQRQHRGAASGHDRSPIPEVLRTGASRRPPGVRASTRHAAGLACACSPIASATMILVTSSRADAADSSTATRSRAPSASHTKSIASAWSSGA